MTINDVDDIYALSIGNPMFYQYCPPFVTRDSILKDMKALPPQMTDKDKFYLGFFRETKLIAVMDLIFHYPDAKTVWIGLFMMSKGEQKKGIGSEIVNECIDYMQSRNYDSVCLGVAKGNPQSERFWKKNGFLETGVETDHGDYTAVVMQKKLFHETIP